MSKPFYITTTLPYVNAEPHIGFATELIRADIITRFHKIGGDEVFFNTGTDDHGQKVYQKALELGKEPQAYTDELAAAFRGLMEPLGISDDIHFIRTTDNFHMSAVQEFWRLCDNNGFIYKKTYQVKYCVGCELEKTDSELIEGKCPLHTNYDLELRDEENYFFKFSAFQSKLLALYEANPNLILPEERFHEIKIFVASGLQDFSISRLASKMPWGVPVPGDDEQVMYVWFDALVNYISTIGWPTDMEKFNKWQIESGGMVQYCGKDNLRQQTAMWQAMLMAAGIPNSQKIIVEGFITGDGGIKMSKSLGNVVSPYEIVSQYGTDALRYYVAREFSTFEDSPFTIERFREAYNANLANGIGNLTSRIMKMAETNLESSSEFLNNELPEDFRLCLSNYEIAKATNIIWKKIGELDNKIQKTEPFKLIKTDKEAGIKVLKELLEDLYLVANMLEPVLPETSMKIKKAIATNKMPQEPLFLRKD